MTQLPNYIFFSEDILPRSNALQRCTASYFGKEILLDLPENADQGIEIGHTFFTKAGSELARITGGKPVDGFYEYVKEEWKQHLPRVETSEQDRMEDGYGTINESVGFVESDSTDGSVNHDHITC